MNKDFNSLSLFSGAAILLIGLIIGVVGSGGSQVPMGGLIHNTQESFDEGIAVDGYERISGKGVLVEGGDMTTIASAATGSVTAAQFCDSSVLLWAPTAASGDLTLPTSASLAADCFNVNGDSKTILYRNLTATAATTSQIVAGTGMVLLEPDGQNIEIAGGASALIHAIRYSATVIIVTVDEFIDAD